MNGSKLYVGNLKYQVSENDLEVLFGNYGTVQSVKVIEGKGFGFVEMGSSEEAESAMEDLNGTDFQGRTLRIDEARPPQRRDNRDRGGYNNRY